MERYSVTSSSTAEFVIVFEVAKSYRKIVKCHSSICKISEGSTRVINNLGKGVLCPHLTEFSSYYRLIQNIPNPEDSDPSGDEDDYVHLATNDNDELNDITLPQEKVSSISMELLKQHCCLFP